MIHSFSNGIFLLIKIPSAFLIPAWSTIISTLTPILIISMIPKRSLRGHMRIGIGTFLYKMIMAMFQTGIIVTSTRHGKRRALAASSLERA